MFVKVVERDRARRLRSEDGLSIKAIATELAVSSSSVSRWVRDIELTDAQLAVLRAANPILNGQRSGTARSSANARARRFAAQRHGRELAAVGDPLHQAGCMLYWAEGHRNRNQVVFTNADADMLVLFRQFLRQCYGVADEQIALTVNVHLGNGITLPEIESWWLNRLVLPPTCLRQAIVNRPSRASQRKRRTLLYGTVCLRVSSTFIVSMKKGVLSMALMLSTLSPFGRWVVASGAHLSIACSAAGPGDIGGRLRGLKSKRAVRRPDEKWSLSGRG
jgi:transcriptional regulator with XRE-family HTH domain